MATGTQLEKSAPAAAANAPLASGLSALWVRGRVRWAGMQRRSERGRWSRFCCWLVFWGACFGPCVRTDWRTLYANLDPEDARQIGRC